MFGWALAEKAKLHRINLPTCPGGELVRTNREPQTQGNSPQELRNSPHRNNETLSGNYGILTINHKALTRKRSETYEDRSHKVL